ncbi:MAG: hypothetical protein ACR2P9_02375 [Gammaproteobacteria bacterium]
MTLSVISRSEPRVERVLFIGSRKAVVYHCRGGEPDADWSFANDAEGKKNFARYLHEAGGMPLLVIVDVFEEEYKPDTIPHVYGPDRAALIKHKIKRLFRDTPYYSHRLNGRQETGRRDDQILFTAITRPEIIRSWIGLLEEAKIPLIGIYSLPLFSEVILQQIEQQPAAHKLLVSMQSGSGLRQTYFHNDRFGISRLVHIPDGEGAGNASFIRDEFEKIRRYLDSLRLIAADESLRVYFLATGELLHQLKQECPDQQAAQFVFCDLNDLLAAAGSRYKLTTPFSDWYFVHQLLQTKPANCYASAEERRYFFMRRLRHGMVAASVVLLLTGVIFSGINLSGGLGYKRDGLAARERAESYAALNEQARQHLPETSVQPAELKVAIDLAERLAAHKTTPLDMMRAISHGLDGYPSIHLHKLNWTVGTDPGTDPADAATAGFDFYQIATIDGTIKPFTGNYRAAIDLLQHFAAALREQDNIHAINILSLPLDVSSGASLHGNAQGRAHKADFSMRVVLGLRHDS